ncbi:MAG: T9SS type A sorting domain-containing protein ['Candidatus Kapabacteria' thiocyanatum]|uniref:Secretion system C-terminal sorting domain-containing protein n=1 Tax=Candidatus Kapaibacterium thiocyanatum TaxID=1895771 RepID=A0A1M3L5F3_9BACT|nr:T9SS type A sorting domain-containing protein ['Candidatus Kapabacteria' thiocyanatum]OJX60783.1 MAG: hypothetical protein BGO89_04255 ['Candidatus Kapabacteria' thiocyanatum]
MRSLLMLASVVMAVSTAMAQTAFKLEPRSGAAMRTGGIADSIMAIAAGESVAGPTSGNAGTITFGLLPVRLRVTTSVDDDRTAAGIQVHPVPARDEFSIVLPDDTGRWIDVVIIDVGGTTVQRFATAVQGAASLRVDARTLANGTYVVRILDNGHVRERRIVIAR